MHRKSFSFATFRRSEFKCTANANTGSKKSIQTNPTEGLYVRSDLTGISEYLAAKPFSQLKH
jgi:hypothetical protein